MTNDPSPWQASESLVWLDAEVHLLPPEWCRKGYWPDSSETVLRRVLYDHPEREVALSRASADGLLEEMGRSGVAGALIMGLPWLSAEMCRHNNMYIASVVRQHAPAFVGMGLLPPPDRCNLRDEVKRIHDLGLKGAKVIPSWQGYRLQDACFDSALAELTDRNMVLMPHTDHPFVDPEHGDTAFGLYEAGRRYPELRILCPHLGGLLCLYRLHPPVRPALENMLFITTVPTTMEMIRFAVDAIGAERVAFGTDFPFNPSHDQLTLRRAFEGLGFDAEVCGRIASRNLADFLGEELS